jgi:hypothetical protein
MWNKVLSVVFGVMTPCSLVYGYTILIGNMKEKITSENSVMTERLKTDLMETLCEGPGWTPRKQNPLQIIFS